MNFLQYKSGRKLVLKNISMIVIFQMQIKMNIGSCAESFDKMMPYIGLHIDLTATIYPRTVLVI